MGTLKDECQRHGFCASIIVAYVAALGTVGGGERLQ